MATSTFYSHEDDGYILKDDYSYTIAHNADEGDSVHWYNNNTFMIGQWYHPPTEQYLIHRGFLFFDTATISPTAIIISATLTLYTKTKSKVGTNFDIVIRSGMPDYPSMEPVLGDYLYSHYSGDGGSINTADCSDVEYAANIINLNETGIDWINRGGYTKFALISSRDIDALIPDGEEYIWFTTGDFSLKPKLVITWFEPTEAPTVTTINLACEDRQATTLTAVGEITGSGDGYTFRGFEYYQYTEEGEYDSSMWAVREIGRFHELGEFRMTLYGLKPSTIYWIRAFAGNIFGTGYGEWILCCTTEVPSYDIHEEEATPTICFYVSEDGGHTWSLKFGPYTTDQVDIAITKILVRGSGKKQIRFETDVLTGLAASVMCKLDVKIR